MLTKADFRQNFRFISLGCRLGILPMQVNLQNGELELLISKWKQAFCTIHYALLTINTIYVVLRLPYLLVTSTQTPFVSLFLHFTTLFGMLATTFWHFTAFYQWPGITVACFNRMFGTWRAKDAGHTRKLNLFQRSSVSDPLVNPLIGT